MVKFRLEMTCFACPEQYDVYLEDEKVGYLRLRHGHFRCDVPDCGGKRVFDAYTEGDGMFDEDERDPMLSEALAALAEEIELQEEFTYEITSERYNEEMI